MRVLIDSDSRSFWIKPVGIPGDEPDIHEIYTQTKLTVEFATKPSGIEIGDILIVYRIGVSKVIFVAETLSLPREVTPQEISVNPWKERWSWTIELRNLTPVFGKNWARKNIKPFELADAYTQMNPDDSQTLGSIKFGNDKLRISKEFGSYILRKIMRIPE